MHAGASLLWRLCVLELGCYGGCALWSLVPMEVVHFGAWASHGNGGQGSNGKVGLAYA